MSQDNTGNPIGTYDEGVYNNLYVASIGGYAFVQSDEVDSIGMHAAEYLAKEKNTHITSSTETNNVFDEGWTPMNWIVNFMNSGRGATIIIVNGLDDDLVQHKIYQQHGVQTGYPKGTGVIKDNTIPGRVELPGEDGTAKSFYSVGTYQFQKDLSSGIGVYGTGGAISFTSDDPALDGKTIGIAWQVPENGDPSFWVTEDLSDYDSDLETLFDQTCDDDISNKGSFGKKLSSLMHVSAVDLSGGDGDNMLYLVSIASIRNQQQFYDFLYNMCTEYNKQGAQIRESGPGIVTFNVGAGLPFPEITPLGALGSKDANIFEVGEPGTKPPMKTITVQGAPPQGEGGRLRSFQHLGRIPTTHTEEVPAGTAKHSYHVVGTKIEYVTTWTV